MNDNLDDQPERDINCRRDDALRRARSTPPKLKQESDKAKDKQPKKQKPAK